ncbi:MAG: hypothetical protein LBM00_02560 [Deltaproteobacteria bacterium]|nr:hypothetical protein [Deltaproteobacteria bacterium]
MDFIKDQNTISELILRGDATVADKAVSLLTDEYLFSDFAIEFLTPQKRMGLMACGDKGWCIARLVNPIKSDRNLLRLANALTPYRVGDWFMIYFLRAIRDARKSLLPQIIEQHPDDAYSSQALEMLEDEDVLAALLLSVSNISRRKRIFLRIDGMPADSPLRRKLCGTENEIPHRFGEGTRCACCGALRDNPCGIVQDKERTYSFAAFNHMLIQIDRDHKLTFRYPRFSNGDGSFSKEIQALQMIRNQLKDVSAYRICASADNDFFGIITTGRTLKLFPATSVSAAGFYSEFFGNRRMSVASSPAKEWRDVIQMVGDRFLLAALCMDGTVKYLRLSANVKNVSGVEGWKGIVQLAMTAFFNGEGILAGLKWDGRLEVCANDRVKKIMEEWKDITFIAGCGHQIVAADKAGRVHICKELIGNRGGRNYAVTSIMEDIYKVACAHSIISGFDNSVFGLQKNGRVLADDKELDIEGVDEVQGTYALLKNGTVVNLVDNGATFETDVLPSL